MRLLKKVLMALFFSIIFITPVFADIEEHKNKLDSVIVENVDLISKMANVMVRRSHAKWEKNGLGVPSIFYLNQWAYAGGFINLAGKEDNYGLLARGINTVIHDYPFLIEPLYRLFAYKFEELFLEEMSRIAQEKNWSNRSISEMFQSYALEFKRSMILMPLGKSFSAMYGAEEDMFKAEERYIEYAPYKPLNDIKLIQLNQEMFDKKEVYEVLRKEYNAKRKIYREKIKKEVSPQVKMEDREEVLFHMHALYEKNPDGADEIIQHISQIGFAIADQFQKMADKKVYYTSLSESEPINKVLPEIDKSALKVSFKEIPLSFFSFRILMSLLLLWGLGEFFVIFFGFCDEVAYKTFNKKFLLLDKLQFLGALSSRAVLWSIPFLIVGFGIFFYNK